MYLLGYHDLCSTVSYHIPRHVKIKSSYIFLHNGSHLFMFRAYTSPVHLLARYEQNNKF